MQDRAEIEKSESDTAFFFSLIYMAEFVIKLAMAGMVAEAREDRDIQIYEKSSSKVHQGFLESEAELLDCNGKKRFEGLIDDITTLRKTPQWGTWQPRIDESGPLNRLVPGSNKFTYVDEGMNYVFGQPMVSDSEEQF